MTHTSLETAASKVRAKVRAVTLHSVEAIRRILNFFCKYWGVDFEIAKGLAYNRAVEVN